jgi:thiol:disulfide interchange protein DsbD
VSSFLLGTISALVVGACVSPVLILALGAAITQGDPWLGAVIMGSMAVGMGLLLVLFGFGAGWLLPKTGEWMNSIQILFGLMVLGVAIYLLESLGLFPVLYLWAALFIFSGFYIYQLITDTHKPLLNSFIKMLGTMLILWGSMSLVGASLGSSNVLNPLQNLFTNVSASNGIATRSTNANGDALEFHHTTTLDEVNALLQQATASQKPVLIDFYADWCLDCKRMLRTTYKETQVQRALKDWVLIKIDVTNTSSISEEVKRFFKVFGPPATLFFKRNGVEHANLRQYGYLNKDDFVNIINRATNSD